LTYLLEQARTLKVRQVSLETGPPPFFAAAIALYERFGFARGPAFADYPETDFNRFYHLALD
jgi:putative acetyltransferase